MNEERSGTSGQAPPQPTVLGSSGRGLVIHPVLRAVAHGARSGRTPERRLEEAVGLARAIALDVVHQEVVRLASYRPATLLGKGAVDRLKGFIAAEDIGVVIVDGVLSPVQQRNLERAWSCKVIDRTGLILEIFGARARTAEGRLQVELASLIYQRSRLVRTWTHLERQRGGFGFLAGPGESQLESDRRLLADRIARLKRQLEDVKRTRGLHRQARQRVPYPVVALVGYTNAGKSTLFNRLVHARVLAADLLFATLDPTMRALALPSGGKVILSDTVGFISDLPTDLVAAFRATLEEVQSADLIIHVRDVSHPETEAQREDVIVVLRELGLGAALEDGRVIEALNKIDALPDEQRMIVLNQVSRSENVAAVSALTGEGCDSLLALIDSKLSGVRQFADLTVDRSDGAAIAWLYEHGRVLSRHDDGAKTQLRVSIDPADLARFTHRWGGSARGA